jgi:hypothetical protein
MSTRQIRARIFAGAIAFAVAGCANATPLSPTISQINVTPQRSPSSKTYQWIDFGMGAHQYDYPKSTAPTRKKVGLYDSSGECSTGRTTFWAVNVEGEAAEEYSYDGKYIRSLSPKTSASFFERCAVSAKSADIAFTASQQVVVFTGGLQSKMTIYPVSQTPVHAGYDPANNLYIDAIAMSNEHVLLELAAGGKSFQNVSLPNELQSAGSVQWDGNYVAVTDATAGNIYRYAITGYAATLKGTVSLKGHLGCPATWIAAPYVFCSNSGKKAVAVYKYPGGGNAIATLGGFGGSIVQVTK